MPFDIVQFILDLVPNLGVGGLIYLIWKSSAKSADKARAAEGKKWDAIMKIESDKWTQKFKQDVEERTRQYEIFSGLMRTQLDQAGLLAVISTRLEGLGGAQAEIVRALEKVEASIQNNMGLLHGRVDKALERKCP